MPKNPQSFKTKLLKGLLAVVLLPVGIGAGYLIVNFASDQSQHISATVVINNKKYSSPKGFRIIKADNIKPLYSSSERCMNSSGVATDCFLYYFDDPKKNLDKVIKAEAVVSYMGKYLLLGGLNDCYKTAKKQVIFAGSPVDATVYYFNPSYLKAETVVESTQSTQPLAMQKYTCDTVPTTDANFQYVSGCTQDNICFRTFIGQSYKEATDLLANIKVN